MARQKIELAAEEAEELSRRARATTISVRDRRRAEIIVLSAQGLTQQRIAEQLGISRVAVNRWVGRFALHRLDGLSDRAGRGRKPWLPPAAVQQVVEQAVTPPPHLGRWSCRTMARAAGISPGQACHQEWLAFLKPIDEETPGDLAIHIIADNYATHKHPAVTRWLDRHARFHMHYTPTSSSWMNLVERFFRDLTEFITEKSFASTRELADAIIAFLAARNDNPRRYVWKAKGEEILRKIDAARQALAALQPASNAISETAH